MTAPAPTPEAVTEQQQAVTRCLAALARAFDVPCACGHISDQCTQRSDGTCDG